MKSDASRSALGAALEQLTVNSCEPISFASKFLKINKERYSINELELLGVVWSIESFKNYLYGKEFSIITDHRAHFSILKEHDPINLMTVDYQNGSIAYYPTNSKKNICQAQRWVLLTIYRVIRINQQKLFLKMTRNYDFQLPHYTVYKLMQK